MTSEAAAVANAANNNSGQARERIKSHLGEAGSEKRQARRKMVIKIHGLLTKTPADERGVVDGTPFSKTGVERLMEVLRKRASDDSQSGAKAAQGMLKFLSSGEPGSAEIGGASVDKLQWVAKMGKRLRK